MNIVDEVNNFKYPDHIKQDEKDKHRMAKFKHATLDMQIKAYEKAIFTKIGTCEENSVPMPLPSITF